MTFSDEIPEKQTLTMCLLSKVVWPIEKFIKHRQSLHDDAFFLIRKQCEPPCDKIDLPAIQRVNKRSPLLIFFHLSRGKSTFFLKMSRNKKLGILILYVAWRKLCL